MATARQDRTVAASKGVWDALAWEEYLRRREGVLRAAEPGEQPVWEAEEWAQREAEEARETGDVLTSPVRFLRESAATRKALSEQGLYPSSFDQSVADLGLSMLPGTGEELEEELAFTALEGPVGAIAVNFGSRLNRAGNKIIDMLAANKLSRGASIEEADDYAERLNPLRVVEGMQFKADAGDQDAKELLDMVFSTVDEERYVQEQAHDMMTSLFPNFKMRDKDPTSYMALNNDDTYNHYFAEPLSDLKLTLRKYLDFEEVPEEVLKKVDGFVERAQKKVAQEYGLVLDDAEAVRYLDKVEVGDWGDPGAVQKGVNLNALDLILRSRYGLDVGMEDVTRVAATMDGIPFSYSKEKGRWIPDSPVKGDTYAEVFKFLDENPKAAPADMLGRPWEKDVVEVDFTGDIEQGVAAQHPADVDWTKGDWQDNLMQIDMNSMTQSIAENYGVAHDVWGDRIKAEVVRAAKEGVAPWDIDWDSFFGVR